ncbi:MAG: hypothetical protein ACPGVS_04360 [Primorskyibacter sp.]
MTDHNANFSVAHGSTTSTVLRALRDAEPALLFGASVFVLIGFVDHFFNGLAASGVLVLTVVALFAAMGSIGLLVQTRVTTPVLAIIINTSVTLSALTALVGGYAYTTGTLDKLNFGIALNEQPAIICTVAPGACVGTFGGDATVAAAEMARSEVVVMRYASISHIETTSVLNSLNATGWNLPAGTAATEMKTAIAGSNKVWFFFEQDAELAHAVARDAATAMGLSRPLPVMDFSAALMQSGQEENALRPGHVRVWLAGA